MTCDCSTRVIEKETALNRPWAIGNHGSLSSIVNRRKSLVSPSPRVVPTGKSLSDNRFLFAGHVDANAR